MKPIKHAIDKTNQSIFKWYSTHHIDIKEILFFIASMCVSIAAGIGIIDFTSNIINLRENVLFGVVYIITTFIIIFAAAIYSNIAFGHWIKEDENDS